jgi:hypothetical protein
VKARRVAEMRRRSVAEVSEAEAQLLRAHREAGRLAAALVLDPFAAETVTRLEDYLPQVMEAAAVFRELAGRGLDPRRRLAQLCQLAVDARPGGGAS